MKKNGMVFLVGISFSVLAYGADPNFGDLINAVKGIAEQAKAQKNNQEAHAQNQDGFNQQKAETEKALQEAEKSKQEAALAKQQAEIAKKEAELARRELELARQGTATPNTEQSNDAITNETLPANSNAEPNDVTTSPNTTNPPPEQTLNSDPVEHQPELPAETSTPAETTPAQASLPMTDAASTETTESSTEVAKSPARKLGETIGLIYILVSSLLGIMLVYRPMMNWYNNLNFMTFEKDIIKVFITRVGMWLTWMGFVISIGSALGCFGGNLIMLYKLFFRKKHESNA